MSDLNHDLHARAVRALSENEVRKIKHCVEEQRGEKMDDLISRQGAIDAAEKESQVDGAYGYMDTKSIVDLLNDLPSVQPGIIRCRDCRYYKTYQYVNGIRKFLPKCSFNDIYVAEEDFCSQAERRKQ